MLDSRRGPRDDRVRGQPGGAQPRLEHVHRCADRNGLGGRDGGLLLARNGRPVATECGEHVGVRRDVERARPRPRTHGPPRRHRAPTLPCRRVRCSPCPTSWLSWPRSAAAVERSSSSTRAAPRPPRGPASGCRSDPAPTRCCCSPSCARCDEHRWVRRPEHLVGPCFWTRRSLGAGGAVHSGRQSARPAAVAADHDSRG